MFAFFETTSCSQGLIFPASSAVCYLGTWIMFGWYLFLRFKDGREIPQINPLQTLMNLQYPLPVIYLSRFRIHTLICYAASFIILNYIGYYTSISNITGSIINTKIYSS